MPLRDILTAFLAVLILGSNFVAIKVGVRELPPLMLTGFRFFFAAIPAVVFIRPPKTSPLYVVAFGVSLGVVQFGLLFSAIGLGMPAGLSSVVIQMQVFFTIALAFVCFRERPSAKQIAGGVISAVGVALLGVLRAEGVESLPFFLVVGAALAWGIANTVTKAAGRIDMLAFVVWGSLVAPVPLFLLSFLIDGPAAVMTAIVHATWRSVGSVFFLAYPTTLLAFGLWTNLLSRYPAASVTPFGLLIPVAGMASTAIVLGERVGAVELLGSTFILAGLVLNLWKSTSSVGTRSQRQGCPRRPECRAGAHQALR